MKKDDKQGIFELARRYFKKIFGKDVYKENLSKENTDIQENIDSHCDEASLSNGASKNNDGVAQYSFKGMSNSNNEDSVLEKIEFRAREYLKTLPYETLVDSALWSFNFDIKPIDDIMFSIWVLENGINSLDALIKKYDGDCVRFYRPGPKPTLPNSVYSDYNHKTAALSVILANEDVRYLYDDYVNNRLSTVIDSNSRGSR